MKDDWKKLYEKKEPEPVETLAYTPEVMDHFRNPRNVGKLADPDGIGAVGDPSCGDSLAVTLTVDGETDTIEDIRFLVYGCAGAVATSSAMTVLAKGKGLEDALRLSDDDVVRFLGGLPEQKRHCSLMGIQALQVAILDYLEMRRLIGEGEVKDKAAYRAARADAHNDGGLS